MGYKVDTQISMLLASLLLITTFPPSVSEPPTPPPSDYYSECSKPYHCGGLHNISYPFWGTNRPRYCGGVPFELNCEAEADDGSGYHREHTYIKMGSQYFNVVDINPKNYTMKLVPLEEADVCLAGFKFSLSSPLMYNQSVHNITLLYKDEDNCPTYVPVPVYNLGCPDSENVVYCNNTEEDEVLKQHPELKSCHPVQVPAEAVRLLHSDTDLPPYFGKGFVVNYTLSQECLNCMIAGGLCGSHYTNPNQFACYYPHKRNHQRWVVVAIVAASVFGVLALAVVAFLFYRRQKKTSYGMSYTQPRSMSSDPSSWKDTEKGSQYFGAHLFSYTELEEATNFFDPSRELGDGGFGTVYYGQLPDGRCIAVKRLYENNYRRVEQFMNEIEILTRLRHKNLVSLFGCTSRHSRELLLVYEYIANGTVADHLHGNRAKAGTLPWHIRMNIALETATALAYLHESEIIHRDVKTNNILLDSHFVVKVADFGLSRLFPNNVTHVSTVPQGTPGYVDPEYHECYQLTVKSDVYSFGVVLVELISSLPAVDITRHRHEINLSNMAINKIQNQTLHELVDKNLGFDSDLKVRKMINAVAELAFQCLQSSKDLRPSMQEVVVTLKDIQSDGEYKSQSHAEVMDISSTADDAVLLKDDPPPPSPASTVASKSTTPNASG